MVHKSFAEFKRKEEKRKGLEKLPSQKSFRKMAFLTKVLKLVMVNR